MQDEVIEAKERIKEWLLKGDYKVYTVLRHVSKSGMQRVISLFTIIDGQIISMDYSAARILDLKRGKNYEGIVIEGCGMDMGFHLVYSLGNAVFGFGKGSEAEKLGIITGRNGSKEAETDGGYILKQNWV